MSYYKYRHSLTNDWCDGEHCKMQRRTSLHWLWPLNLIPSAGQKINSCLPIVWATGWRPVTGWGVGTAWCQVSVCAGNGWPCHGHLVDVHGHALQWGLHMPISCHFWDCKALNHLENTSHRAPPYLSELITHYCHYLPSRALSLANTNLLSRPSGITSNFTSRAFSLSAQCWCRPPGTHCLHTSALSLIY